MSKIIKQSNYRKYVEDRYWYVFVDWLQAVSLEPRNGEDIITLFWYWYIRYEKERADFTVEMDKDKLKAKDGLEIK